MIRLLRDDERAWANEIYRSIAFAETPAEALAIVAEHGGERVGLGRLVELEPGVVELGGIWTAEAMRGRGIARAIVDELLVRAPAGRLWCIPFVHLVAFYESCGFRATEPPWPASVRTKLAAIADAKLPPAAVLTR